MPLLGRPAAVAPQPKPPPEQMASGLLDLLPGSSTEGLSLPWMGPLCPQGVRQGRMALLLCQLPGVWQASLRPAPDPQMMHSPAGPCGLSRPPRGATQRANPFVLSWTEPPEGSCIHCPRLHTFTLKHSHTLTLSHSTSHMFTHTLTFTLILTHLHTHTHTTHSHSFILTLTLTTPLQGRADGPNGP